MGLTNAERQRRYRDRKRAEQRKATEGVTGSVTAVVTRNDVTSPAVDMLDLGVRGRRLWQQVTDGGPELQPGERVLLEEACRSADRLDVLDRILRGDEDSWMRLHSASEDGTVVKVVLNNALAEARQQQTTLARLLAELRQSRTGATGGKPGTTRRTGVSRPAVPAAKEGGGVVADLAAWIADRGSATG